MSVSSNLGILEGGRNWRVIGISFTLETLVPVASIPRQGSKPAQRVTIVMNIYPRGSQPVALFSMTTDDEGRLTQATSWRAGDESLIVFNSETCSIKPMKPPTDVTLAAIIEDSIGPLSDPRKAGFDEISPDVFQRDEGPVDQRVTNWENINARVIEMVGHNDGKVKSRIYGISVEETEFDLRKFTFPAECSSTVDEESVREMLRRR